jgi:ribosomal protein S18 acetylase RimI-like enzyme
MPVSIRRAVAEDAEALAALAARLFPLGCPETDPADLEAYIADELSPASILALIENPNVVILVATAGEAMIAYMVIELRSPHPAIAAANRAQFRKLYVSPEWHGRGVAGELMRAALDAVDAAGARPVWLSVFSENPRAIAFYRRYGFEIAGEQEFLVGSDRQRDFLMLRVIPG